MKCRNFKDISRKKIKDIEITIVVKRVYKKIKKNQEYTKRYR